MPTSVGILLIEMLDLSKYEVEVSSFTYVINAPNVLVCMTNLCKLMCGIMHRASGALLILCVILQRDFFQLCNVDMPTGEEYGVSGEDQPIHRARI
jgi:hypothetical protein